MKSVTEILVLTICAAGCARPPAAPVTSIGGPSGIVTWTASGSKDEGLPGVDRATVCYEGGALVIWSDFAGGSASSSSNSTDGMVCRGQIRSRDGQKVEFRCQTKDAKTGPVTIGEANFDLADGNLFLIAQDGERFRVSQLKRDLDNVQFTREKLEEYARKDPEIVAFFTKPAKSK